MIQRWNKRRQVLIDQQKKEAIALTEDRAITLEGEGAIALAEEAAAAIAPGKEGDKPFWSSSTARYCTKELKTAEVDRYLRQFKSVFCAVGIRAEESTSRAKKPRVQVRNDITTASLKAPRGLSAKEHEQWAEDAIALWKNNDHDRKGRLALTWNAVLDWPLEQVWKTIGTSSNELAQRRALYQAGDITAALSRG